MRGVAGLSDADARVRLGPTNCISWNVGHPAWPAQRSFIGYSGGEGLVTGDWRLVTSFCAASNRAVDSRGIAYTSSTA